MALYLDHLTQGMVQLKPGKDLRSSTDPWWNLYTEMVHPKPGKVPRVSWWDLQEVTDPWWNLYTGMVHPSWVKFRWCPGGPTRNSPTIGGSCTLEWCTLGWGEVPRRSQYGAPENQGAFGESVPRNGATAGW